ncbi:hypothetical protein PMIN04_011768 [Paraphaeosphaeria minitans]|uniref:Uncharacterized protein n=1 Tax=Paraphaeosphaeria minitans TaxID=565426 RepID=A0A9P6G9D4_9PLEO|nr:hypothetical protein PMIN01_12168 [Paraphaeosphaeria minitans]
MACQVSKKRNANAEGNRPSRSENTHEEEGDTESEEGGAESEEGDVESEEGDAESEEGDTKSEEGYAKKRDAEKGDAEKGDAEKGDTNVSKRKDVPQSTAEVSLDTKVRHIDDKLMTTLDLNTLGKTKEICPIRDTSGNIIWVMMEELLLKKIDLINSLAAAEGDSDESVDSKAMGFAHYKHGDLQ